MLKRIVNILKSHSFFLFGPRSTGKSTLLLFNFPKEDHLWVDLVNSKTESLLRQDPEKLEDLIEGAPSSKQKFIIIDEIQKNPKLLDVVHRLSFERKIKFALTGSSARKLKRGAANLLAGRAFSFTCFPLTHIELEKKFDLDSILAFGSLPEIFELNGQDRIFFLRSYVETYFKEEVSAEQLVRNLIPFRNFLEVASHSNGKILNINNIAHDIGVDHSTVKNYSSILEDTMLGFLLPPYHGSIRKRQQSKSKFYYFDLGVQRALSGRLEIKLEPGNYEYGEAFEHFIILEFFRLIRYKKPD
ncbi:MAG: ATP-binding protein [Bdellovibrionales bacterium]|nr:ATP-binding protein [Bdellovibrionales bacterium]